MRNRNSKQFMLGSPKKVTNSSTLTGSVTNVRRQTRPGSFATNPMKRVFSIFSFTSLNEVENTYQVDDVDPLHFDDESEAQETNSVLSDRTLTTFGDLDAQAIVGTLPKPRYRQNKWGKEFNISCETEASNFLWKLVIEPQRRAWTKQAVQKKRGEGSDSLLPGSHIPYKRASIKEASFEENLFEIPLDEIELLKFDIYLVIKTVDIGKIPAVILTDLFWALFHLNQENEIRLVEAHIIVRYIFQLATEGDIQTLCFQMFNTSRSGILSLKEVNEFVAHACSHSIESVIRIPAALKLFKRYLKNEQCLEELEFILSLYPYVCQDNANVDITTALKIYRLHLMEDSAYGVELPSKYSVPIISYFERILEQKDIIEVPFDIFQLSYEHIKAHIENKFLPNFVKKAKRSNRLGTKLFRSIKAIPVPGLELKQFEKLLRVSESLNEHCERVCVWINELRRGFARKFSEKQGPGLNEMNHLILKRRIPL